ncbi:extracellular matrix regulator RemB [Aureibacillus halotolerans]|uniref:Uncharacterized protein DUF370 n=1 Tax=Aureibacillus halotolerans TaxID=1508390 RepID=A0A4R6TYD9_9BACI|nr:extracellular matrix/biofilm biosynthesis regulator RemA family protein [Aureibacillus halotolerans]TDQ38336.1 uncharacterized protein DUF370 [Aureibacillus halotolerans]
MFIHIGEDVVVRSEDVVAILDRVLLDSSLITQEFINETQKDRLVFDLAEGMTKSIVVMKEAVYFSPLSSVTLKKRADMIQDLDSQLIADDQGE